MININIQVVNVYLAENGVYTQVDNDLYGRTYCHDSEKLVTGLYGASRVSCDKGKIIDIII